MGMRGNPEGRLASKVALLCCAFLFIFSVLSLAAGNSSSRDRSEITSWRTKFDPQGWRWRRQGPEAAVAAVVAMRRRGLMGPGSHPPRCTSRCGACTPCWPVHVPVPPRAPADAAEYYPEAWRCKCGGRLYVP
ncbi:EPIDERMAL PATTERNING FACTOR-like protein 4 [Musa acuminata AAA Group]|uniref:EPIDERMAL PATTERNING FACTOR-like protein 4 n=1 Tax=Musa acuminata AAA Group TaxID=214697 RepID=UPI0031E3AD4E